MGNRLSTRCGSGSIYRYPIGGLRNARGYCGHVLRLSGIARSGSHQDILAGCALADSRYSDTYKEAFGIVRSIYK